jgi:hypothetical protein
MSSKKLNNKKPNKKVKKEKKENLDQESSLEEIFFIRESYCMACDSPLNSYNSLICPECLEESAEILSTIIESQEESDFIVKNIFIDPNFESDPREEDIEEDEIFEEEEEIDFYEELPYHKKIKLQINNLIEELSSKEQDE